MSVFSSIALALACLLVGIFIGASLAQGEAPEPGFVEGAEIRDPDPTPLTCDRRTARDHMRMAAAILRRAYSSRRIVEEHPLRRRERRRWRYHRRCVLLPKLRAYLIEARDRARRRFDGLYLGLVTPPGPGVLAAIAACESHGDPGAVSASGSFRGKYQFDYQTWGSVGGSGDPAAAPEREQDLRAAQLYQRRGSSPWPVCG